MPWKIIRPHYEPLDPSTLHDDEMIAIESALRRAAQRPSNEPNPSWRAWRKVRPLAAACTGEGDPVNLLPPEARASLVWSTYRHDPEDPPAQPRPISPVAGL